jgi:alkylation response protein AidB-like acyl-CoA dehydrogenase
MGAFNSAQNAKQASTFEELMEAAVSLLPLIEAEADKAEQLTHQTDAVAAAVRKAGLYDLLKPRAIGGPELSFIEALKIIERISYADGSAGWCVMVNAVISASVGSFLPEAGCAEMFANGPDVTLAGQGVPSGFAEPVEGGYMVKGNWSYGSSIYHADWVHSGCFITKDGKMAFDEYGKPMIVVIQHRKETIELKGNWDVHGLRATGSYDYTLKDDEIFIPESMCYMSDGAEQQRGGIQYNADRPVSTACGHTGWVLGVTRRALDELAKLAPERRDVFGKMSDGAHFKLRYAEAEAKFRAARAFVYQAWNDLCESFERGEAGDVQQIACVRLAMRHAHQVASEIVTFAHIASRGVSLRPSVLQRCYRDIHGGTQHLLLADEIVAECGTALMGTAPENARWGMFGISAE